jgi:hypothetical protein
MTGTDQARQVASGIETERFERSRNRRTVDDQEQAGAEVFLVTTDASDLRPLGTLSLAMLNRIAVTLCRNYVVDYLE